MFSSNTYHFNELSLAPGLPGLCTLINRARAHQMGCEPRLVHGSADGCKSWLCRHLSDSSVPGSSGKNDSFTRDTKCAPPMASKPVAGPESNCQRRPTPPRLPSSGLVPRPPSPAFGRRKPDGWIFSVEPLHETALILPLPPYPALPVPSSSCPHNLVLSSVSPARGRNGGYSACLSSRKPR